MLVVRKKYRNRALRVVFNQYVLRDCAVAEGKYFDWLRKKVDVMSVLVILEAQGLIAIKNDRFVPTKTGKSYLEDQHDLNMTFWRNSVLVPILVALITTLAINYIPKMPELIQGLSSIHSSAPASPQASPPASDLLD